MHLASGNAKWKTLGNVNCWTELVFLTSLQTFKKVKYFADLQTFIQFGMSELFREKQTPTACKIAAASFHSVCCFGCVHAGNCS